MKRHSCVILATVVVAWLSMIVAATSALAAPQNDSKGAVKCVKRAADLQPPRELMPSLRTLGGREEKIEPARKLEPVCPSGEVPELSIARTGRRFPKGNPLIGPYAQPEPVETLSGEFIRKNLVRPFDQVYWKREGKRQETPPKPISGSGDAPCNGVPLGSYCYYYGSAAEMRNADGGGMTYTIQAPVVDNSGDNGGHSIGQIAVQGGPSNGDDVEMGWSVSPDQFNDTHPHLFVFHWINWDQNLSCYANGAVACVWNQYSSTYYPGMDLSSLAGQNVYIGWVHYRAAWWGWFNDQWLGSIPDSEWTGAYTKTALIQWYGEVESNNGIPPKTQMGNGEFPSQRTAASMSTLCDVDAKAWLCFYRDLQSTGATVVSYYDILNHTSFGAVRYGGPGQ
jgi:hypothetical protein